MARNFAGGTDRVLFGGANGVTAGCVAFWFKTSGATTNTNVMSCWSGSSRTGFGLLLNNTANKITAAAFDATTQRVTLPSATTVNDGTWRHLAYNFNTGSGSAQQLYINGTLDASTTATAAWSIASSAIAFGDPLDAFWATYNGDLADCGFWNTRNLDAAEIAALAKGYSPKLIAIEALGGYWPFARDQFNRMDPVITSTVGTTVSDHPRIIGGLT